MDVNEAIRKETTNKGEIKKEEIKKEDTSPTENWHHGWIEEHEAEIMLRTAHFYPNGSFLVRDDLEVPGNACRCC